jgi:parallel beta-helix repeat protein
MGVDGSIRHMISNVMVRNAPQDSFAADGQGEMMWFRCHAYNSVRYGFNPTFDSILDGCTASQSGLHGYHINTNPVRMLGCKSYYSGKITPGSGMGFYVNGGGSGGIELIGCEAQDNRAHGFQLVQSENINVIGCVADSNNGTFASTTGTFVGVDVFTLTNSNVEICCMDRQDGGAGFNRQLNAIQMRSGSINNRIRLTHLATAGAVSAPVQTWDADCLANEVSINGSQGQQNLAYAATITPNPTAGGTIIVGALTGALTIAAVAAGNRWPGQLVTFHLTQDATGGRVITWNAAYHLAGGTALPTTLSRRCIITFEWDATLAAYVERSRSVGI